MVQVNLILSLTCPGIGIRKITVSCRLPASVTTTSNWKSSAIYTHINIAKNMYGSYTQLKYTLQLQYVGGNDLTLLK